MASSLNYSATRKSSTIQSPPFCWIIFSREGDKINLSEETLQIFREWQDAQDYIDSHGLSNCRPKIFYWEVMVEKYRLIAHDVVLNCKDGTCITFPMEF